MVVGMQPRPLPDALSRAPFRTRDALAMGLTQRRLRAGDLWTPTRGVRIPELPRTLVERARAFAVAAPGDFAFSHITAAQLLGLPLPYAAEEDTRIHIVTRTADNRIRRPEVVGHRGLESREIVLVHDLPVVAPADTWVDLGEYIGVGRPIGLDDVIIAGDAAANLTGSVALLREAIEKRVRPRGKVTLTFALQWVRLRSWSAMETRSRLMVVRAGLPEPVHNADLYGPSGDWLGCGDLVWEEQRVVGEYQGVEFHSRPNDVRAGRDRQSGIENGDWAFVEIVAAAVFDSQLRAAKLRELAGHLGHNPHLLRVWDAEPQFFAPQQFARPRRRRVN